MKILMLSTADSNGGAAIAAFRLHKELNFSNAESIMIVRNQNNSDSKIISLENSIYYKLLYKIYSYIEQIPVRLYGKIKSPFSPAWIGSKKLIKLINKINPDIVHLHWINHGFLKIEDIPKIKAPVIWTLHDLWPITGGCHTTNTSGNCNSFISNCGECPILKSNNKKDLSFDVLKKKNFF